MKAFDFLVLAAHSPDAPPGTAATRRMNFRETGLSLLTTVLLAHCVAISGWLSMKRFHVGRVRRGHFAIAARPDSFPAGQARSWWHESLGFWLSSSPPSGVRQYLLQTPMNCRQTASFTLTIDCCAFVWSNLRWLSISLSHVGPFAGASLAIAAEPIFPPVKAPL